MKFSALVIFLAGLAIFLYALTSLPLLPAVLATFCGGVAMAAAWIVATNGILGG